MMTAMLTAKEHSGRTKTLRCLESKPGRGVSRERPADGPHQSARPVGRVTKPTVPIGWQAKAPNAT